MLKLIDSQRQVLRGMAAGLILSIAALAAAAWLRPFAFLPPPGMHSALLAALAPTLTLAACIARLAAHRFLTPQDIDGSGLTAGSEQAKLLQALLQNTLEQATLAMPVYAAWSAFAPASLLDVVLAAALLFLCGRMLFVAGYRRGAGARACGFALTFYPTVLLLAGSLYFAIARG